MNTFSVGEKVCQPSADGVFFDLDDSGATLLFKFSHPTAEETRAFKSGISVKFAVVNDIIFILARMGTLSWADAPYNKHLSKDLTVLNTADDGQGLAITAMLVDANTGILKALKLISLDTNTTRRLTAAIMMQPEIPNYHEKLSHTMATHTTSDLVKFADAQENETYKNTGQQDVESPETDESNDSECHYVIDNPFEDIEGLKEIILAQQEWVQWKQEVDKQIHADHFNPPPEPKTDLFELYKKYPFAYTYLVVYDYAISEHPGRAEAGNKALHRILCGEDYRQVLNDMEYDWETYCAEHGENPLNRTWNVDKQES